MSLIVLRILQVFWWFILFAPTGHSLPSAESSSVLPNDLRVSRPDFSNPISSYLIDPSSLRCYGTQSQRISILLCQPLLDSILAEYPDLPIPYGGSFVYKKPGCDCTATLTGGHPKSTIWLTDLEFVGLLSHIILTCEVATFESNPTSSADLSMPREFPA